MDIIGFDVHKRESQLCTLHPDGSASEQRIVTSRDRITTVFGTRAAARILIEASTESEWVAQCLEGLGHDVIVADPNYAPMYATRSRRVKTDKRDARTLAEALRLGAYRPGQPDRRGRTGPTTRRDPLRDVARQRAVHHEQAPHAPAIHRASELTPRAPRTVSGRDD